jgi:hypothetical protein
VTLWRKVVAMPVRFPSLLLLALALALTGCATPRYEMVSRLEAPTDAAGLACLTQCEDKLKVCQQECSVRYQTCLKEIEPLLDAAFEDSLRQYAMDLDSYAASLQHYEFQLWMGWHQGPWWFWPGWTYPYYVIGPPPARPSREAVHARVVATRCDKDCGCQPGYEACFLTCGGRKVLEERCVANCPEP